MAGIWDNKHIIISHVPVTSGQQLMLGLRRWGQAFSEGFSAERRWHRNGITGCCVASGGWVQASVSGAAFQAGILTSVSQAIAGLLFSLQSHQRWEVRACLSPSSGPHLFWPETVQPEGLDHVCPG